MRDRRNEKLAQLLGKNEHDMQHMQTQMTQIHTDRQRLAEQYAMLRKSLDHTTGETAKVKLLPEHLGFNGRW